MKEVSTLHRVNSPGVVNILDSGFFKVDKKRKYFAIVTEKMDGTLKKVI